MSSWRIHLLLAVLPVILCVPRLGRAADEGIDDVERISFDQKRATGHMMELEERMYRLAELIREEEPDKAARLLMALKQSREELILEEMNGVEQLLTQGDLSRAENKGQEVLQDLNEIRELLLSVDLDLEFRIKQLRQLQQTLERVARAVREETQQGERTGKAIQADTVPEQPDEWIDEQNRTRRFSDGIIQSVIELGSLGNDSLGSLQDAVAEMQRAVSAFEAKAMPRGGQAQLAALEDLLAAQRRLEEARDQLLDELRDEVRRHVMEEIGAMIEKQEAIRHGTEEIAKQEASTPDRESEFERMAGSETGLAGDVQDLLTMMEDVPFSVVLPPALRAVQTSMQRVAARLEKQDATAEVRRMEKTIEEDLAALLEALKDSPADFDHATQKPCSQCGGGGNRAKLVAELRMLRLLEEGIRRDTKRIESRRMGARGTSAGGLAKESGELAKRQEAVRSAAEALHERVNAACGGGGHEY